MTYYRVKYKCNACKHTNVTRKKKTPHQPARCADCHSFATQKISSWKVKK